MLLTFGLASSHRIWLAGCRRRHITEGPRGRKQLDGCTGTQANRPHRPQTPPFVGWELGSCWVLLYRMQMYMRSLVVLRVGPQLQLTNTMDGLVPDGPPSQAKLPALNWKGQGVVNPQLSATFASDFNKLDYLLLPSPPRQLTHAHHRYRDSLSLSVLSSPFPPGLSPVHYKD